MILGRCADEILREAGMESLNVFIHADAVHRAVRASELTGCTDATELQKIIAKKDNSRHTYYNHYTGKKWGDSHNYHLVLDSGKLGYSLCTKLDVYKRQAFFIRCFIETLPFLCVSQCGGRGFLLAG